MDFESSIEKNASAISIHEQFNDPDADIAVKSIDGIAFRLHRMNLKVATDWFVLEEIQNPMKYTYIDLPETAAVLELLFLFVYPKRHPTLETIKFELLAPLAEAAEEYEVFAAINICLVRMKTQVEAHPIEVFNYAMKHGYNDLANDAAFFMVDQPLDVILDRLSANLLVPWLRYYHNWMRLSNAGFNPGEHTGEHRIDGEICPSFVKVIANLKVPASVRRNVTASMWMSGNLANKRCDHYCSSQARIFGDRLGEISLNLRSTFVA